MCRLKFEHRLLLYNMEMQLQLIQDHRFNSLRPSDAIWRQWSWTTLAQVMACCLTAPSHYLNQFWLIIRGVLWHTSESSFAGIAQGIDSGYEFEKDILKNIFKSPRGQWVKTRFRRVTGFIASFTQLSHYSKALWCKHCRVHDLQALKHIKMLPKSIWLHVHNFNA